MAGLAEKLALELEQAMRDLLDAQEALNIHKSVLAAMEQQLSSGGEIVRLASPVQCCD